MWHKIIAFIFFIFGAVQYNDPDFYIWIPIYFAISAVAILYDQGKLNPIWALCLLVLYLIGMVTYTPEVIDWIQNGSPSITGTMQAESPFIEFVREFFGLGICAAALLYYWRKSRA